MIEIKPKTVDESVDEWLRDGRFGFKDGFYDIEWDQNTPFVWTGRTFVLENRQSTGAVYFVANYLNEIGELTATNPRTLESKRVVVKKGWYEYLIEFEDLAEGDLLEFELNRAAKVPNDARELGLRIKRFSCHDESSFRTTEAPSPAMVTIETSTVCNLKCVMCAHAVGGVERDNYLDEHLLKTVMPHLKEAHNLLLNGVGEGVLSPTFWKIAEHVKQHEDLHTEFNSNALLFDDKMIHRLIDSKFSVILISIDASTKETYRKIRGADFDLVLRNVEQFQKIKKQRKVQHPLIYMNMTLMRENIEELPDFVRLAKKLGADKIVISHLFDDESIWGVPYGWSVERDGWRFDYHAQHLKHFPRLSNEIVKSSFELAESLGILLESGSHYLYFENDSENDTERNNKLCVTVKDCRFPWQWAQVRTNGDVVPCCYISTPDLRLGNLREESFDAIWNGKTAKELRQSILCSEIHELCAKSNCIFTIGSKEKIR